MIEQNIFKYIKFLQHEWQVSNYFHVPAWIFIIIAKNIQNHDPKTVYLNMNFV